MKLPQSLAEAYAAVASTNLCGVYFLRLHSGQVYIGSTTDLRQRLIDHSSGRACRTTANDPPVALLRFETFANFTDARSREAQLKRWSRAKKEALILGDVTKLIHLAR